MKRKVKRFPKVKSSAGIKAARKKLREEFQIYRHHKSSVKIAEKFRHQKELRLNLGCGPKYKTGWVNIDLLPTADLQLDIRENFPFSDSSVSLIYSEHLFEHLEYPEEVNHLLRESLRILQPGGKFSVGVPDLSITLFQYVKNELPDLIKIWSADKYLQWFPSYVWKTPMSVVNFGFRQGTEHKFAYDFETLKLFLEEAGFVNVQKREFDPELDSEDRRDGTLYVDGFKLVD